MYSEGLYCIIAIHSLIYQIAYSGSSISKRLNKSEKLKLKMLEYNFPVPTLHQFSALPFQGWTD